MTGVRWKQRFNNYSRAFKTLAAAVELSRARALSDLEGQGLIQSFEFTHELAWNVLKDFLTEQGIVGLIGSKDATRTAFKNGLIEDGEAWMRMIGDRNRTSHTYHQAIEGPWLYPAFEALLKTCLGRVALSPNKSDWRHI